MSFFVMFFLHRRLFILSLCLLFVATSYATPPIAPLYQSSMWLKLGHYHTTLFNPSDYISYVEDSTFFISADGRQNPEAELKATIALFHQPSQFPDSPSCRYQTRYQWLTEQGYEFPPLSCPEYDKWRKKLAAHSVTMVFPSSEMNSPSSMFGHTLLRFDPANIAQDSLWLSWAVNFGAMPAESDNAFIYIWKGIFGGYPGNFAMMPYYRKLQEYSRLENRDIWEYRLNLSPEQTAFIGSHIWELKDINFDYYYADKNCSFRLLELLELSDPNLDLTSYFPTTVIPVDTVRAVWNTNLVESIYYRPSNATMLRHLLAPLSEAEQALVYDMAQDPSLMQNDAVTRLPQQRQARMILSAYKYLRYEANNTQRSPETAKNSLALLEGINHFTAQMIAPPLMPDKPENGHDTAMISLDAGHSQSLGNYVELQGRMNYHDLLDNHTGFPEGAEITIGNLRVRGYEGNYWQTEQLDLIHIRSHYPYDHFFKPLSWQGHVGFEHQPGSDDKTHLAAHINGGVGISMLLSNQLKWFGLATLRLEHNHGFAQNLQLAPGINTGFNSRNSLGNWQAEWQLDQFLNGQLRSTTTLQQHWEVNQHNGIRLGVRYEDQDHFNDYELSLSWRHYF